MKIDDVVQAYVDCGNSIGFFWAEMILMKYLPEDKPDGKCFDVPRNKRSLFVAELKSASAGGMDDIRDSMSKEQE